MEKEVTKIDKDGNKTIFYEMKYIDSERFMTTSLSNLADNLTEGIHKIKCRHCDCFF